MRASLGGMGRRLDTGGRVLVVRLLSGGDGTNPWVEWKMGYSSSSFVRGRSVALLLTGVEGVSDLEILQGDRAVAPSFGDSVLSLA